MFLHWAPVGVRARRKVVHSRRVPNADFSRRLPRRFHDARGGTTRWTRSAAKHLSLATGLPNSAFKLTGPAVALRAPSSARSLTSVSLGGRRWALARSKNAFVAV